jgi:NAD+ diphosphatase
VAQLDGWSWCPRCRNALDRRDGRVECSACGFQLYASSAPTASALCVDAADRLLLARRAHAPDEGLWDLPGGFLDEGEHPLDALRRELKEETGLDVEPGDFVGACMDRYEFGDPVTSTLNLYWTARIVGGEEHAADDVSELRWFPLDALPPADELAFRCNGWAISALPGRNE